MPGGPDVVGRVPQVPSPQLAPEMRKHGEEAPGAGPFQHLGDHRGTDHRLCAEKDMDMIRHHLQAEDVIPAIGRCLRQ